MKAEELRIGNWIRYAGNEIELTRQKFKLCVFTLGLDELHEPIPLTEEWLVKFGFNYEDPLIYGKSGWYLKLKNQDLPSFIFFNNHLQCSLFISSSFNMCFIDTNGHCEHVHQLQNLYFALTGTELTIK
jgi:hypothetical protein